MSAQSTYSLVDDGTGMVEATTAVTANPFTLSIWAKTSDTTDNQTAISLSNAGTGNSHVRIMANNTSVWRLNVVDSLGAQTEILGAAIVAGVWTHLVVTQASGPAGGFELFINGVSQGTLPWSLVNAYTKISWGALDFSSVLQFWNGQLDQPALWDTVLSNSDILALAGTAGVAGSASNPASLSPVGLWRMEEGTGTTTADTGSGGNTGAFTGGVTWSTLNDVPVQLQAAGGTPGPPVPPALIIAGSNKVIPGYLIRAV